MKKGTILRRTKEAAQQNINERTSRRSNRNLKQLHLLRSWSKKKSKGLAY
jgi:hypothetical protein